MERTAIDAAYLAQAAEPEADAPRLRFHERVLDAELFLLLEAEPEGDRLDPRIFETEDGRFVLAFDRDDRLAAFIDAPAPYAALAGRRLVAMLAGRGIGIGLNLGEAPSATLLPAAAVDWMAGPMAEAPVEEALPPRRIDAPRHAPIALISALDPKLAAMAAVIGAAYLVAAEFEAGAAGLLLVLVDVPPAALPRVAAAVNEAVRFSGLADQRLDVTFLGSDAPALSAVRKVGLAFELPRPLAQAAVAPDLDADRPPGPGR